MAVQFSVSVSFVVKLLQRQRRSGSLAALPRRSGPAPCLDAPARAQVAACVRQQSDSTLDYHAPRIVRLVGGHRRADRAPGHARTGRAGTGLAAKEKSVHAAERDSDRVRALRSAFIETVQAKDFTCFKFVDETSTNLTFGRRYARAEGGQRVHQATPLHGGPNMTLVAALTPDGLQAAMTVSGAVNGDVFAAYLEQVLAPTLVPGDVVVPDNLPAHRVAGLAELVKARGARRL